MPILSSKAKDKKEGFVAVAAVKESREGFVESKGAVAPPPLRIRRKQRSRCRKGWRDGGIGGMEGWIGFVESKGAEPTEPAEPP